MRITNEKDLPAIIVRAIENDPYDGPNWSEWPEHISVTTLIDPPRIAALKAKHDNNISMDVSDCLFMLKGRAMHHVLELGKGPFDLVEHRLWARVAYHTITGQLDHLNDGILTDWKNSDSRWKVEWEQQLNCLDYLCMKNNIDVASLRIGAFRRGWIEMIPVTRWTRQQQLDFIGTRVDLHDRASEVLPECTDEETWNTKRCAKYCVVSQFCDQWKELDKRRKPK